MNAIYDWLVELYRSDPALPKALLAGTLVSTVCGVIGCFIILRRMSFLADALSHSMLAGVVGGYLLMKLMLGVDADARAMIVGAILAGFLTVGLIGFVTRFSRIKEDTAIGIMYTGIFAGGGVVASLFDNFIHVDLYHFVIGQVLAIKDSELWVTAIVCAAVLAIVILLFRQFQLISFDPIMAASLGIPVLALDYLLTACTSLVVVSGVQVVGVILVVAMLITPAATAYLLFDRLQRMLIAAAILGWFSFVAGMFVARAVNVTPGPMIVLVGTFQFLFVLAAAPRYGLIADWLRRRSMVPQSLVEDVLGSVLKAPEQNVPIATVQQFVTGGQERVRWAMKSLERQGLLDIEQDRVRLTEQGQTEARRLLRAHRLWETYLQHVGVSSNQLHAEAHRLEHVNDEEAIDYLDDKLGHPLVDPHGAEIPEDFVHLVPGAEVNASLLREGHSATVVSIAPGDDLGLSPGEELTAGPRLKDDQVWTFHLPSGRRLQLDHATADRVLVRLHEMP